LVAKDTYTKKFLKNFIGNYFGNSFSQMVSFFAKEENIDLKELEEILKRADEARRSEN
jgi:predicted transcriptional regulator